MVANGRIAAAQLSKINTKSTGDQYAYWFVARDFEAMVAHAARDGITLTCNEGYRSYERQHHYYYVSPGPKLAAYPGNSNHGWGIAIDVGGINGFGSPAYKWLSANAHRYGFSQPWWAKPGGNKLEPWHWEHPQQAQVHQPILAVAASGGTPSKGFLMALTDQDQATIKAAADRVLGTQLDVWVRDGEGGAVEVVERGSAGSRPARNLTEADGNFIVRLVQAQATQIGALTDAVNALTAKVK